MDNYKQPLKCTFGFHDWGQWTDIAEGTVSFLGIGSSPVLVQEKECRTCGAKSRREVNLD